MQPLLTVNDDGSIFTQEDVEQIRIIPTPAEEGKTFILGRQIFSSAYLFVNYDENQFTLWQARDTDDANLVAVGRDCSA